jgi:hypothetical protein
MNAGMTIVRLMGCITTSDGHPARAARRLQWTPAGHLLDAALTRNRLDRKALSV